MTQKMRIIFSIASLFAGHQTFAQEFKVVTIIESIVPLGAGRSRMLDSKENVDYHTLTTEREVGTKSNQANVSRSDVKIDKFEETKLLNFYSFTGINFQNIASNDAVIGSKINTMIAEGWMLVFVTSGVESKSERGGDGIFITRLFFKK
jgi:hypothetical protein